jgi:uncharacterized protein DUF5302
MAAGKSEGSAEKAGSGKAASGKAASDQAVSGSASSGSASSGSAPSGSAPSGSAPEEMDDLKRKFREALDRKKDRQATANTDGAQATGKVHDAHGPASSRRSFRRKSGS